MFFNIIFVLVVINLEIVLGKKMCEPFNFHISKQSVSYVCDYESKVEHEQNDGDLVCKEVSPEDCADWSFSGSKTSTDLTVMKLNTFAKRPDSRDRTLLNVSLTNIGFTNLRYRIQGIENKNLTFCTEIKLPPDINVSDLYFDCYWVGTKEFGATSYKLEYEAQKGELKEARTFLFKIKSKQIDEKNIKEWFPFLYIDRTEFPVLIARWHQTPESLERPDYRFKVYDGDEELQSEIVRSTDRNSNIVELNKTYNCGIFPSHGSCKIEVQVLCTNCKIVDSPIIFIGNSARKILIGSILGFLFIILMILLIFFVWKKRNQPYFDINKLPKVLMLYSPSTQSHIRTVTALAEYLRENCFVVALLDQLDVPRTATKDPFLWYNEAFRQAGFIMVISSPTKCCNQGIFKNVDNLALNFVTELLSRRRRPHIFNVTFDYCDEEHIPEETKNFHSYRLTKDLDKMLWHIHNNGKFPTFINVIFSFLGPKLYGGQTDLKTSRGRTLLGVLKAAENHDLNVCNCKNVNAVDSVNTALYRIPEMTDYEEEYPHVPDSNYAVGTELNKFFIDLENLILSGEDDNTVQPANKELNMLNFLNL